MPRAAVIWLKGTPMALAFSRSMVTRSCGSFEVKVVFMPVSPEPGARDWPTMVWATRSMSPKVLRPASCSMNWKPPTVPMPAMAGGSAAKAMPPGTPKSFGPMSADDGVRRVLRAHLGALVDGLERSEDEAGVRRTAAGKREAHDREGAEDAIVFADDVGDAVGKLGGVAERSARRRLHDDEEVGLVLLRDEGRGDVVVHEGRRPRAAEEEQQHHVANAHDEGDGACVDADHPLDEDARWD